MSRREISASARTAGGLVLNEGYFNFCFAESLQIMAGDVFVRDRFVNGRNWHDQRQAPSPKFRRIANHDSSPSCFGHRAIYSRFELIWCRESIPNIEAVHGQKKHVRAQLA